MRIFVHGYLASAKTATCVAVGVAAVLLSIQSCRADLPTGKKLLTAVRHLRDATRSGVRSGHGTAVEIQTGRGYGGQRQRPLRQRVDFWFSGHKCLWKAYGTGTPRKLHGAMLVEDGIAIRYFRGAGPPRKHFLGRSSPNVSVDRVKVYKSRTFSTGRPLVWTYRRLTAVSPLDHHDRHFFSQASKWRGRFPGEPKPTTTVTGNGHLITVLSDWPASPKDGLFGITREAVFDLAAGGMVTRWKFWTDQTQGAWHGRLAKTEKTTWHRVQNHYLPSDRVITSESWKKGKDGKWRGTGSWRTKIRFLSFSVGPVRATEFSVAELGIPSGTPVVDSVHRSQYYYSPAHATRLLGQEQTPNGKPASGGN